MTFTVRLAAVRGMCRGVERAIRVVDTALRHYGPGRVWVLHEVVHNQHVVADLRRQGATFVEDLADVPDGGVLIFSAHGVSLDTYARAEARGLRVIDATCPVVARLHRQMNRAGERGVTAVVIGHPGHQEVIGTLGQYRGPAARIRVVLTPDDVARLDLGPGPAVFVTQTTLAGDECAATVAALRAKYPQIRGPRRDDTCAATQSRQDAVRDLARDCDLILIAGSGNSSNSNRLREVAARAGARAYLIEDAAALQDAWLRGVRAVGVSAGASVPEYVVTGIIAALAARGGTPLAAPAAAAERAFPLPAGL